MATSTSPSPTRAAPVVLDAHSLIEVLETVVRGHLASPTSIVVVCSSKEDFVDSLQRDVLEDTKQAMGSSTNPIDVEMANAGETRSGDHLRRAADHHLLQPTIHMLASATDLKMAFCPSTAHTLAYLANLSAHAFDKSQERSGSGLGMGSSPLSSLFILNPVAQHEGTRSYSAQGLTRFFSTAVSTANAIRSKLIIAECRDIPVRPIEDEGDLWAVVDAENAATRSPWDEQVAITNVKVKGAATRDPTWQGRTVSLRAVAEKWCTFEKLSGS
ncbi:hypothetical protein CAC42_5305 [Sphaceloma murrayae]|uniref:Uncharacterized protein n=1 Tax=Sphaceloma murrayae TaxID=2082308 RepID=A0A2K1QUM2_9PEZI|nr:hypothetical protein CAC42_5305 [Sphaceloma murrayae]